MSVSSISPAMPAAVVLVLIVVAALIIRDPMIFQQTGPRKKYEDRYVDRLRRIGKAITARRRNGPLAGVLAVVLLAWAACAVLIDQQSALNEAAAAVAALGWLRVAALHHAADANHITGCPSRLAWVNLACSVERSY